MKLYYRLIMILSISSIFIQSCKKFVQIDPPKTQLVNTTVFENDATATAAMLDIYARIFSAGGQSRISRINGMSADELINYQNNNPNREFYNNSIIPANTDLYDYWSTLYKDIFSANSILEGLQKSTGVNAVLKKQLTAEAKFIRAFSHFYLVNNFGDVPLVTTTDYRVNNIASRTPKAQVYQQIITDLLDAQQGLEENYLSGANAPSVIRVRPNKSTATALLARVYLFTADWANAELQSTSVITNNIYKLEENLDDIFLSNSEEAIWQVRSSFPTGTNTPDGDNFILIATPVVLAVDSTILSIFEAGDARKSSWTKSIILASQQYWYPYKYKVKHSGTPPPPVTEFLMVLRLAEQYLIRAEARIQQDNIAGGIEDLNSIRRRASINPGDLPDLSDALPKEDALLAVEKERRLELFTEWGHRWMDLKRTGRADAVLAPIKGSNWQTTDALYPIPQKELSSNTNLLPQNDGYQ